MLRTSTYAAEITVDGRAGAKALDDQLARLRTKAAAGADVELRERYERLSDALAGDALLTLNASTPPASGGVGGPLR
jgi:hypothetical protein